MVLPPRGSELATDQSLDVDLNWTTWPLKIPSDVEGLVQISFNVEQSTNPIPLLPGARIFKVLVNILCYYVAESRPHLAC